MKEVKYEDLESLLHDLSGTHVLVLFGDGQDRPAQCVLSSRNARESYAICDFVRQLRKERSAS